jgi:hypothetical protein
MITAFAGLLAVKYLGFQIGKVVRPKAPDLEKTAVSYLLGIGFFTLTLFLANLLNVPYAVYQSSLILIIMIALAVFININQQGWTHIQWHHHLVPNFTFLQRIRKFSLFEKIVATIISGVLIWALVLSSYWPVTDWDSIVLYDFRAKSFVHTGFMQEGLEIGYFLGYPLLVSLGHAWLYMLGFYYPGLIHSLFYVSFTLLFYVMIRKIASRKWALIWTLVFSMSSQLFDHALMTYTNLPYTVYLVSGYFYFINWIQTGKKDAFIMSAILIGLSTWTRSAEPFWVVIFIFAIAMTCLKKQWLSALQYGAIVLLFRTPWQIFEKWHARGPGQLVESASDVASGFLNRFTLSTIPQVLQYFYLNVLYPGKWMYFLLILATILMGVRIWKKRVDRVEIMLFLIIGANLSLTLVGIYYFSIYYDDWLNIGGSAQRMSLFFGPLITYFIAYTTHKSFYKPRKQTHV